MQEVTLSLKEFNNLLKDSKDLVLISLENKKLKRQLDTANEHIKRFKRQYRFIYKPISKCRC